MIEPVRRFLGRSRPRIRRVVTVAAVGLVVFVATAPSAGWQVAALVGWDVAGLLFLAFAWHLIMTSDAAETERVATVADESRRASALLIVGASLASLVAVACTLAAANGEHGPTRGVAVGAALLTLIVSWSVLNTLFTLRYADVHYREHGGVDFASSSDGEQPDYLDFAYLAFTIGMCYQVSDQAIRSRRLRRTVLRHALISYVFGVIVIASGINVVAGLVGT